MSIESERTLAAAEFGALFDAHHESIWSFVRRRVSDRAEADDLTSEVFLVAWRRRVDLPPSNEQRLWLFGVARNVLNNHRRSLHRQRRLLDRIRHHEHGKQVQIDDATVGDGALSEALHRLPDDARDLLMMRAWDGLAVRDIAVLLDCTPNAVSLRLRRARAALEAEMRRTDWADETEGDMGTIRNDCAAAGHVGQQPTTKGES